MDISDQCNIDELFNDFDFSDIMENEHLLDHSINLQEINSWHETSSPLPQSHDGSDSDSGFSGQSHLTDSFPPLSLGIVPVSVKAEQTDIPFDISPLTLCDTNLSFVDESSAIATPLGSISRSSAAVPTITSAYHQSHASIHPPSLNVKTMVTSKGVKAIIIPTRRATLQPTANGVIAKTDVAASNLQTPSASSGFVRNVVRINNGSCYPTSPAVSNNDISPLSATAPLKFPLNNLNSGNQVLQQSRAIVPTLGNDCKTFIPGSFTAPLATIHPRINQSSLISNGGSETPVKIQPKYPGTTVSTPMATPQYICPNSVAPSYAESVDFSYSQSDTSHHVERFIKKQVKMIKNRQAASLSRQRKKEYLERMEKTLEDLREENNMLRHQNMEWQNRYMELESLLKEHEAKLKEEEALASNNANSQVTIENGGDISNFGKVTPVKKTSLGLRFAPYTSTVSPNRSTRTAFATPSIFLCLTGMFLLTWWSPLFTVPTQPNVISTEFSTPKHYLSRTLLSSDSSSLPSQPSDPPSLHAPIRKGDEDNSTRLAQCLKQLTFQQQRLNEQQHRDYDVDPAEDISLKNLSRISSELNDILYRHSLESRRAKHLHMKQQVKQPKEPRPPVRSFQVPSMNAGKANEGPLSRHPVRDNLPPRPWTTNRPQQFRQTNQLQLYNPLWEPQLNHFVPESERENDTMYLVSLGPHHLMYPASKDEKNQSRPKMTFVIPTMYGLHDAHRPRADQLALMRISCEVRNFTVVHVDKWKLPYLYRSHEESMSANSFQRQRGV